MQLAPSLRLVACSAVLAAFGCGEDPANANVCPNLPLYHIVRDQNGADSLVKPNGQPLSSAELNAIAASEQQGCTTGVGTALTDPGAPPPQQPPPASGGGGAGGTAGADGGA